VAQRELWPLDNRLQEILNVECDGSRQGLVERAVDAGLDRLGCVDRNRLLANGELFRVGGRGFGLPRH
jgi:hypothetical protein